VDCWGGAFAWWGCVESRTSWLELVAAFVSVIVAVWLAIAIQRRDFKKRNQELQRVTKQQETERRHALFTRALDVLESVVEFALGDKATQSESEGVALRLRVLNTQALIRSSGAARDALAGSWFEGEVIRILNRQAAPEAYQGTSYAVWVQLRCGTIRSNMLGWLDGTADPSGWTHPPVPTSTVTPSPGKGVLSRVRTPKLRVSKPLKRPSMK